MKRRGDRKAFPPSRALLAERGGRKATATWGRVGDGWRCIAARRDLSWMRGMTEPQKAHEMLKKHGFNWYWLTPLFSRPIEPPFQP
jgi:hypothetical protein